MTLRVILTAQQNGDRMKETESVVRPVVSSIPSLILDPRRTYQTVVGFGGALTEASGYALTQVSPELRARALRAYFDPVEGIGYTLARTHINSCDFSLGNWACCETPGDVKLETFTLAHDRRYLIPLIHDAQAAKGGLLKLYASPWSPPAWMKDTGCMNRGGKLLRKYYSVWADYFVRWIRAYEQEGIPIWGVTVQNEPQAVTDWDNCVYDHEEERDFVKTLGLSLHAAGLDRVKLMIWDHNKDLLVERARTVLGDPEADRYVWGLGFHWYGKNDHNSQMDNRALDFVTARFPEKKLVSTENCCPLHGCENLHGEWWTGEKYGTHVINDLNHNTVAWTDWNIVLDERGGPNHVNNFCDAPIIADGPNNRLIFQSSYYYLGHFSKFIVPGSRRIGIDKPKDVRLNTTAFRCPDGSVATVVMNTTDDPLPFNLMMNGTQTGLELPAHAIATVIMDCP